MRSQKINRLLPIYISIVPLKFGVDIQSQTKVSPETKNSNMATRRPFWKWLHWKSIGSYPYTCIVPLKFGVDIQTKLKLESGNQKIQYDHQAAILKVTSLKINRLLPMTTINMHMKFEIEIPKQTWLTLRKPCHLQSPETKIQAAILKMMLLKINRLLPIYISIVPLKFEADIQS